MKKIDNFNYDLYDGSCYVYLDTDTFLENTLDHQPKIEKALAAYLGKEVDDVLNEYTGEIAADLAKMLGYKNIGGDNSYNHSSDLTHDVDYHIVSKDDDWFYSEDTYIILKKHISGDIRANYTENKIYKLNHDICEALFLEQHVGIYFDQDGPFKDLEEFETFYTSQPQYSFNERFHVYGVKKDGTILAKCKETNKRTRCYASHQGAF